MFISGLSSSFPLIRFILSKLLNSYLSVFIRCASPTPFSSRVGAVVCSLLRRFGVSGPVLALACRKLVPDLPATWHPRPCPAVPRIACLRGVVWIEFRPPPTGGKAVKQFNQWIDLTNTWPVWCYRLPAQMVAKKKKQIKRCLAFFKHKYLP